MDLRSNSVPKIIDHKEVPDNWKEDMNNGFNEEYFNPNGTNPPNTADTPMPSILAPENLAAMDPESRAITIEQYKPQAMTTLRFDQAALAHLTRQTMTWANSGPPKTYTPKRRRAAPRQRYRRPVTRKRTYKKWVPYKTWKKQQSRR